MLYSLTMSRTSLYVTNQGKPGLWVSLLSSCALNCPFTVVMQDYKAYVNQEHVIRGNDVLFKCDVPSFVADFVSVQSWADNEGVVHATHSQGNREICIRQLDIRNALDLRLSFFIGLTLHLLILELVPSFCRSYPPRLRSWRFQRDRDSWQWRSSEVSDTEFHLWSRHCGQLGRLSGKWHST